MKLIQHALAAALVLGGGLVSESEAQIFLASKPHPDFTIGPVFLIANVQRDLSVTVNLSFSLTPHQGADADAMEQDLFLLWPAEIAEPSAPGAADPALVRDVHQNFVVLNSGRLMLRSRDRTLVGTGQLGDPSPKRSAFLSVFWEICLTLCERAKSFPLWVPRRSTTISMRSQNMDRRGRRAI